MKMIPELVANVTAAKAALDTARSALKEAVIRNAPHKIGEDFVRGGMTYKVERITASEHAASGWMICRRMTTGKKWSTSTHPVPFSVEA